MNFPTARVRRYLAAFIALLISGLFSGCGDEASQSPAPPPAAAAPPPPPDPSKAKKHYGPAGPGSDSAPDSAQTGS